MYHFKRYCDVYLSWYTIFLGNETAELDEMYQKYLRAQEKYQKEFWCPKVDCGIEGINELCPETCTSGKKRDIYCRLYCYRCYKIHSSPKNRSNTKYVSNYIFPVVCKTQNRYGACVFPFNYKNKQYHGCTRADENGGYTFDTPWCAFKVKANGDLDGNNWERCDMTTCAGTTFYNKFL